MRALRLLGQLEACTDACRRPCTVDAMVLADFKADDREWHDCKEEEALMVDHLTDSILMSLVEEQVGWLESMG